jgi:HAD superfamily hydrolase (TIGR01509 family)
MEKPLLTTFVQAKEWIFFDLDNTIIDTETLAFYAAVPVCNRILKSKDIEETYKFDKLLSSWLGQTFKSMIVALAERHNFSFTPEERKEWALWEEDAIIEAVSKHGKATKGVTDVLEKLVTEDKYKIAIVSSSSLRRMMGCLKGVKLDHYFDKRYIYSAQTTLPTPISKPEPDIYLFALQTLGIEARQAIAIEDSLGGVDAARGAKIDTIGYTGCINAEVWRNQLALDMANKGVSGVMTHWSEFFELLSAVENQGEAPEEEQGEAAAETE